MNRVFCMVILLALFGDVHAFSCNSVEYTTNIRNILYSASSDYDIFEGTFYWYQAGPNFGNPSGVYGTLEFPSKNYFIFNSLFPTYILRSQSAIIFPSCSPPKMEYISFTPYLWTRLDVNSTQNISLLASLSASLNQLVWNVSDNNNDPFDTLSVIIQSNDKQTFNDLNDLLLDNDISSSEINEIKLPSEYINFLPYQYETNWYDYKGIFDVGRSVYRASLPHNKTDFDEYIKINQSVFIVQPKNALGNQPRISYEPYTRNVHSSLNIDENVEYESQFTEYKNDLIKYFKQEYKYEFITEYEFVSVYGNNSNLADYGFKCIESGRNCLGDCRDAFYTWVESDLVSGENVNLDDDTFYVILGLVHSNSAIKQATYSNLVIYINQWPGPTISVLDYNGSASTLPVKTKICSNTLSNLFVVQMTKESLCIDGLPGWCLNDTGVALISSRNYLNPITATRPDPDQIISNILLEFKIKKMSMEQFEPNTNIEYLSYGDRLLTFCYALIAITCLAMGIFIGKKIQTTQQKIIVDE
eukprot:100095_1